MTAPAATSPAPRFAGKTVIITGASRGIGAAMALAFAREGAQLVLGCLKESDERTATEALIAKTGARLVWVSGDIAREETSKELCKTAIKQFGRIDIVIANAGVSHFAPFAFARQDDLDRLIGINQLGVYFLLRETARPMKTQKSGVILVVSSIFASHPPKMNALYAGTKAFAEALTKGFAVEHAAHGIRANVIAPGPTATDMNNVTMSVSPEALARTTGFGRLANPDEIAAAALFLCSDDASYISGQVLNVDGIAQG